jgi:hypothetical protein
MQVHMQEKEEVEEEVEEEEEKQQQQKQPPPATAILPPAIPPPAIPPPAMQRQLGTSACDCLCAMRPHLRMRGVFYAAKDREEKLGR